MQNKYIGIEAAWVKLLNAFGINSIDEATRGDSGLAQCFNMASRKLSLLARNQHNSFPNVTWEERVEMLKRYFPTNEAFDSLTQENLASLGNGESKGTETESGMHYITKDTSMLELLCAKMITFMDVSADGVLHAKEALFNRLEKCMVPVPDLPENSVSMIGNLTYLSENPSELISALRSTLPSDESYPVSGAVFNAEDSASLGGNTVTVNIPSVDQLTDAVYVQYVAPKGLDTDIKIVSVITNPDIIERAIANATDIAKTDHTAELTFKDLPDENDEIAMAHYLHPLSLYSFAGLVATVVVPATDTKSGVMAIIGTMDVASWIVYHLSYMYLGQISMGDISSQVKFAERTGRVAKATSGRQPTAQSGQRKISASFDPSKFA